ncbi:TlpA family protein disulfide reductase [Trinickia soli]|uniref:Redoxin n=1 Tax=Trinickia soli TaxID=380675 RepID=A0A2N7W8P1_9BURK|nr:TlpA disulfide reductase family protein [Trinickia soli]KAA0081590.1 TlpA family protein disulfide reductase [Paraburkholderia sp. T12-10]PMS25771.1 redoxin [Trinickia soli]CAB3641573.1 Thiol-disulfide oxidoreductase ResA [Trinickia soli]
MKMKPAFAIAAVAVIAALLGVTAHRWLNGAGADAASGKSAAPAVAEAPAASVSASEAVAQLLTTPLRDVDDKPQTLAAYKGRVLVVNFWASWCGPCVAEMPELVQLHDTYQSKGIEFVGIGVDSRQNVQNFLKRVRVDYPIFVSGFGGADLARNLGNTAGALPFTVVIDANGAVRSTKLGQITPSELRKTLDTL